MIYLVRHGQTEFNREGRFQGGRDSPLTPVGEAQADAFGRLLAGLTGAATPIVCSPLGRTRATAERLRAAGGFTSEIVLDPRLAEIGMGAWDGLTWPEIVALRPPFDVEAAPRDWFMRSPDGETYDEFAARLADWIYDYSDRPGPVIAVSHGISGKVLRGLYAGVDKEAGLSEHSPQDAIFRLHDGRIDRFECAAEAQP
ncbi:MAG TPA: histidine phosphatase family protein [Caulobacteraceae bacterium]|jgi:probable phosphoglycerate mutase